MATNLKPLTDFLISVGIEIVPHSGRTYMAHVVNVYRELESHGSTEDVCRGGMFHSIYGTDAFSRFSLPLDRRPEVRDLIGERAEQLAYWHCARDRALFHLALEGGEKPVRFLDRFEGEPIELTDQDFVDLGRIHLYDWLEQVPRSKRWNVRRKSYRRLAEHLGDEAVRSYNEVFAAAT